MPSEKNYHDFHLLIEISVKFNRAFKANQHLSTPNTKKNLSYWQNRLQEWIDINYDDCGINKYKERNLLDLEEFAF